MAGGRTSKGIALAVSIRFAADRGHRIAGRALAPLRTLARGWGRSLRSGRSSLSGGRCDQSGRRGSRRSGAALALGGFELAVAVRVDHSSPSSSPSSSPCGGAAPRSASGFRRARGNNGPRTADNIRSVRGRRRAAHRAPCSCIFRAAARHCRAAVVAGIAAATAGHSLGTLPTATATAAALAIIDQAVTSLSHWRRPNASKRLICPVPATRAAPLPGCPLSSVCAPSMARKPMASGVGRRPRSIRLKAAPCPDRRCSGKSAIFQAIFVSGRKSAARAAGRRGRGRAAASGPASANRSATRFRLVMADLDRRQPARREQPADVRRQPAIIVEPVGTGEQGLGRLMLGDARRQARRPARHRAG